MTDCIFCKIVQGEIPSAKVYEDDKILAFLDISPVNKGHALVITKEHYDNMLETPDEELKDLIVVGKKIAHVLEEAVGAHGVNVGVNTKSAAGQAVFHTHFHIIPRFTDDGLSLWPQGKYEEGEPAEYAEKIKKALKEQ